jgi:hypothetical protein
MSAASSFGMRIIDTDAKSYWKMGFAKVLEQHEKEKYDKYLQNCLEMRNLLGGWYCRK